MAELYVLDQAKITILSLFNLIVTLVAFALGYYKIRQFRKKSVNMSVDFDEITLEKISPPEGLKLTIESEIGNSGLEPTSISKVECIPNSDDIESQFMDNYERHRAWGVERSFEKIRVQGNDREQVELIATWLLSDIPDELDEIEGEIVVHGAKNNHRKEFSVGLN